MSTIHNRWHGWEKEGYKTGGGRLVELDAETVVDQWPVPNADLRNLDNDNLVSSV